VLTTRSRKFIRLRLKALDLPIKMDPKTIDRD
jgi:hypothetical protein